MNTNTITKAAVAALLADIERKEGELRQAIARFNVALQRMDDPISPAPVTIPGSYRDPIPSKEKIGRGATTPMFEMLGDEEMETLAEAAHRPQHGLSVKQFAQELLNGLGLPEPDPAHVGVTTPAMFINTKTPADGLQARREAAEEEKARIAAALSVGTTIPYFGTTPAAAAETVDARSELLRKMRADGIVPPVPERVTPRSEADQVLAMKMTETTVSLKKLFKLNEVLLRFLSAELRYGATGLLKPGIGGLQQYREDLRSATIGAMIGWPTGFYRNATTQQPQLLLNLGTYLLWIDPLDGSVGTGQHEDTHIHRIEFSGSRRILSPTLTPSQLDSSELIHLVSVIQKHLTELEAKA